MGAWAGGFVVEEGEGSGSGVGDGDGDGVGSGDGVGIGVGVELGLGSGDGDGSSAETGDGAVLKGPPEAVAGSPTETPATRSSPMRGMTRDPRWTERRESVISVSRMGEGADIDPRSTLGARHP